ncbi:hypothetical protein FISHEDRAFT_74673 [Fistulina hepatica ATCC 64428]|uniref:CHCH domain-containing protein n=1 Tax=Fistulina hepatica ATCC 64428 TaxID=1128425 RepID=A0A0D7ABR2_9AGAR|nr:hypothetical protein FISHEDRAFT_74673 [Fistulina hepatica ATCC 64428]
MPRGRVSARDVKDCSSGIRPSLCLRRSFIVTTTADDAGMLCTFVADEYGADLFLVPQRQTRSRPAPARASNVQARRSSTMVAPTPAPVTNSAFASRVPPAPAPVRPSVPSASHGAPSAAPGASASQGPGLFSQMAATAGGVAVGSTIGHGISSMLFGGSSSSAAEVPAAPAPAAPVQYQQQSSGSGISCDVQAKDFTTCLERADYNSCTWYLEQLKACQAAAAPY